jgi:NTP pyrophosphatase (non-canonical NTP hydrolase)
MDLDEYQRLANETDQTGDSSIFVAILGLAGEVGTLASSLKKLLRDGENYTLYPQHVREELGDILWYLAILATKLDQPLSEVANGNLSKIRARWADVEEGALFPSTYFDDSFPPSEQIPRKFKVKFEEVRRGLRTEVRLTRDGNPCGDRLTDNAAYDDGYRYHDVFHLAYAAVLGWSPVTRKLLGCKRRSDKLVDEIQDGGRASVIEEGIAALVFGYAEKHQFLDGTTRLDFDLLKTVKDMTKTLEISNASWRQWERAILEGYKAFRILKKRKGGFITVDLATKSLTYSAK